MNMTTQALQASIKALRAITIDDNYHDAKCDTDEVYKLRNDAITLCEQALSQPNEPVARVIHQFETPEGTREILCVRLVDRLDVHTKLYTAPPNTLELEQANKVLEAKCKELENEVVDLNRISDIRKRKAAEKTERIAELEAEILKLKGMPMKYKRMEFNARLQQENADLTAKVEKMREALEFYANRKNWHKDSQQFGSFEVSDFNILYDDFYEQNQATRYSGKIAKQALEECK